MNEQQQADLAKALSQLRQRYAQWRLGQLIANLADWADKEVWDVDDEQLLAAAREHLEQQSQRAVSS